MDKNIIIRLLATFSTAVCAVLLSVLTYLAHGIYEDVAEMRRAQVEMQAQYRSELARLREDTINLDERLKYVERRQRP